jgi:hypothetical protein
LVSNHGMLYFARSNAPITKCSLVLSNQQIIGYQSDNSDKHLIGTIHQNDHTLAVVQLIVCHLASGYL